MKRLFKGWVCLWVISLMMPIIFSPFAWLPTGLFIVFSAFLLWWGLGQVCPQVDWEDSFDWGMAYSSVSFFGSMMAFLLPYSYGYEQSLSWNNWCQVFVLIWLLSIIVGLILTLKGERNVIKGAWRITLILLLLGIISIFVISLLGMCGIYII